MTTPIEALRCAAKALVDRWDTPAWKDVPHTGEYIAALRAALAQPESRPELQPAAEPVAWAMCAPGCDGSADWAEMGADEPAPSPGFAAWPLYDRPTAAEPLSEEQAIQIWREVCNEPGRGLFRAVVMSYVRGVEAAHGIGAKP